MVEVGNKAPDFELPDQDGQPVKLSRLRGRPVVVYFYPKASTPGCTTQACGVRDHRADYQQVDAVVLGISPDSVAKVKKFHDKEGLNFPLLADEGHRVADTYGVWVEKSMYGLLVEDSKQIGGSLSVRLAEKAHDGEGQNCHCFELPGRNGPPVIRGQLFRRLLLLREADKID